MSACYSADLVIKVKDENGAIKALNDFIDARSIDGVPPFQSVNFNLDQFKARGIGRETLPDLIAIFIGGNQQKVSVEQGKGGFVTYSNGFNASYSWGPFVLDDMFAALAPFLEDGSSMTYDSDESKANWEVEDGVAI